MTDLRSIEENLEALGLSASEAEVYISLLELGGAYVSTLAKRAEIERTNCYYILRQLADKGLVSSSDKGKARYYLAGDPNRFLADCEKKLEFAQQLVPQLTALQNTRTLRGPNVRTFDSKKGVGDTLFTSLESSTEIMRYSNLKSLRFKYPAIVREYCKRLAKKELRCRIISPADPGLADYIRDVFPENYIKNFLQILYVSPKEFLLEDDVAIYSDSVSIISLTREENHATVIESPMYATTSRASYELAWLGASRFEAK